MVRFIYLFLYSVAFLVLFLPYAYAQQQQLTVSLRVGAEIDSIEREYFGLLPALNGAASCIFLEKNANEVMWKIYHGGKESGYTISRKEFAQLGEYIERYEHLTPELFDAKMPNIARYVLPQIMSEKGDFLQLTLGDSSIVSGELLYMTDSCLVLKTDTAAFVWEQIAKRTRVIHYSEIILYHSSFSVWGTVVGLGTGAGGFFASSNSVNQQKTDPRFSTFAIAAVVGTSIAGIIADLSRDNAIPINRSRDRFLRDIYPRKKYQFFKVMLPIEIINVLKNYKPPEYKGATLYPESNLYRWHCSVVSSFFMRSSFIAKADPDILPEPSSALSVGDYTPMLGVDVLYALLPRLRIGGGLTLAHNQISSGLKEWDNLLDFSITQPYLTCEYVLITSYPDYSKFFELSAALSPGVQIVRRDGYQIRMINTYEKVDTSKTIEAFSEVIPMAEVRMKADIYVERNFSLFFRAAVALSPGNSSTPDEGLFFSRFGRRYGIAVKNVAFATILPTMCVGVSYHF